MKNTTIDMYICTVHLHGSAFNTIVSENIRVYLPVYQSIYVYLQQIRRLYMSVHLPWFQSGLNLVWAEDNGVEGAPIARFQETGSSGIPRMKGPLCPLTNY
jgi:hypothetical protein